MDLILLLIVIVVPICVVGCVAIGFIYFYKYFVLDRRKPPVKITPVNYIPPRIIVTEEIIETFQPLSKREKRRVRYRHLMADLERQEIERQHAGFPFYDFEEEDDSDEENNNPSSKSCFRRLFGFASNTKEPFKRKGKRRLEDSPRRAAKEEVDEPLRAKRFMSQDRLERAEARKGLIPMEKRIEAEKEEEVVMEDKEGVVSIIDLETMKEERIQAVIHKRLDKRKQRKVEGMNGEDKVTINAGPSPELIPKGFRKIGFIPNTNPENMLMKRVMYLWDMPPRASGWFCGIVISTSRLPGNNYAIKYDRYETDNIFVDGVHHYDLPLVGENAYGRRWILLDPMDGVKVFAAIAPMVTSVPSPTSSRQPSRPTSAVSSRKESRGKSAESSPPSPVVPFHQPIGMNAGIPQTEDAFVMDIV